MKGGGEKEPARLCQGENERDTRYTPCVSAFDLKPGGGDRKILEEARRYSRTKGVM